MIEDKQAQIEHRIILENQVSIMMALLSLTQTNRRVSDDLYTRLSATRLYLGVK